MSNEEKLKRAKYRKFRNNLILVQAIVLFLISSCTIYFSITYFNLNKEEYVTYTEKSSTDYKVYLKDNPFFDEEYQEKGQSYIASIIDTIESEFVYNLIVDSVGISFQYSYWIDAELEVVDNQSGRAIYKPVTNLVEKKTYQLPSANNVYIKDKVTISYDEYNKIAQEFITAYNLDNSTNRVILKLHVDVNETAAHFADEVNNSYVVSINIPLTTQTVNIDLTSTIPASEKKILLLENIKLNNLFKNLSIIFSISDLVLIIGFICFLIFTKNCDIDYSNKVKRIIKSYKSYIQRILNPFEYDAYKVIHLASFTEMLDIRDTVRSPILMYENDDQTCSTFVIPTNTDLLYMYELKVADYEQIYQQTEVVNEVNHKEEVAINESVAVDNKVIEIQKPVINEVKKVEPVIVKEVAKPVEPKIDENVNKIKIVVKSRKLKELPVEDHMEIAKENREIKRIIKLELKNSDLVNISKTNKVKKNRLKKKLITDDLYTLVTRKTSLEGNDPIGVLSKPKEQVNNKK